MMPKALRHGGERPGRDLLPASRLDDWLPRLSRPGIP
jgi:hypothetical protein